MKIGIFDSGIGGLSVLQEAYHQLSGQEYIFYADTDHVPYGNKEPEEILGYCRNTAAFLIEQGVSAILIACNTATSVAVRQLRQELELPIIGMEPAVKPAVEQTEEKRVLVMATPVTLRETKLKNLIERVDEHHRVDLLAMPELVRFAESEQFDSPELHAYLEAQFSKVHPEEYSALVMGCTHFNYFKDLYRNYFPDYTAFVDGNAGTIRHLMRKLDLPAEAAEAQDTRIHFNDPEELLQHTTYYMSGRRVQEKEMLDHFLRLHNRLEEMRQF